MRFSRKHCLLLSIIWTTIFLGSCKSDPEGDDSSDGDGAAGDNQGGDSAVGGSATNGNGGSSSGGYPVDEIDACSGRLCSGHGTCVIEDDEAKCECDEGFYALDLTCVDLPVDPTWEGLPSTQESPLLRQQALELEYTKGTATDVTFGIQQNTCSFPFLVTPDGIAKWTCEEDESCDVELSITDKDDTARGDVGTLSIECSNTAPTFSDATPEAAAELVVYNFVVACSDGQDDPLSLSRGAEDTCLGTVSDQGSGNAIYSFVPGEDKGGTTCNAQIVCSDGIVNTSVSHTITIAETNRQPSLGSVPSSRAKHAGLTDSYTVTKSDLDVPVQTLALSVDDDCQSFDASISEAGLVSYECGAPEQCTVTITVTDDGSPVASRSQDVPTACENLAPTHSAVPPRRTGKPYQEAILCTDPELDSISVSGGAAEDTCGGNVTDAGGGMGVYAQMTPAIADSTCNLAFNCTDSWGGQTLVQATLSTYPSWDVMSAGDSHSCGIRAGELYCWGSGTDGRLGLGDTLERLVPTQVGALDTWSQLDVGKSHSCAISGGSLYCFGENDEGELGQGNHGNGTELQVPTAVGVATDWQMVSAGERHTCGIRNESGNFRLYCWGANSSRQLGLGDTTRRTTPTQVGTATDWTSVYAGNNTTCGLRSGGALYCWGRNGDGQVGINNTSTQATPALVTVPASSGWTAVSVGEVHTCGILGGALYCWGRQENGQTGLGAISGADVLVPTQVGTDTNWTQVVASNDHTCGVRGGVLSCFGRDNESQLGVGNRSDSDNQASPITTNPSGGWTSVSSHYRHNCALNQGNLYCWGRHNEGQIGKNAKSETRRPFLVVEPEVLP